MSDSKQSSQSRFMIAAVLSMAVLLIWSYFFAPKKPTVDNANTAQNTNVSVAPQTPAPVVAPVNQAQTVSAIPDNTPNKSLTIKTPLYQAKLDSKGALATSWILIKNVSSHGEKLLNADGSTKDVKKPLELIPQKALESNPRELPFRLVTGDAALDNFINERNYEVSIKEENVELMGTDAREVVYLLKDEAAGLEITKTFIFHADNYLTDLKVKVSRNGQAIPNVRLAIGASIGDQGTEHHNYYQIESEAVAFTNGKVERHPPASLKYEKENSSLAVNGDVDWAGVGDAYFAMAVIPAQKANGLEFRSSKYEVPVAPFYDGIIATITRSQTTKETRHLLTAYVPISADDSTNKIYTGAKDYFLLSEYNDILSRSLGRKIDLEDFVNFSSWDWFRPIFKPISIVILKALSFLNQFTHNYGISIVLFTIFFYSLLFPMRWYQSRSFKKAQKNAPKMKEIQERMKELQRKGVPADDPRMREVQMEQLKMTKDALPIGGCLPLLLQMPLLVALYTAVTISLDFRQESFLWLPDLSTVDPYYILPFLFAGSMFISMLITPTTPTITPEQQMQQNMMKYMMPLMMLWIGWSVPSGLLVYWIMGNVVSFIQQKFINKLNNTDEPGASGESTDKTEIITKKPKLSTT
jgi:YidC/Oxa1 family membrane protein insertase